MNKQIYLTFDIEHDTNINYSCYGFDVTANSILEALSDYNINSDFFISTDILVTRKSIIRKIFNLGHHIGNHNSVHDYLCKLTHKMQYEQILTSSVVMEDILGSKVTMFRAPNFGVNHDTLNILEELEYKIDSSILPGRNPKLLKIFPVYYNFKGAPLKPYHPSSNDILAEGNMKLLEIPVTPNPIKKGVPIGGGALKHFGLDKTIQLIENVNSEKIILLFHPWEFLENKTTNKLDDHTFDNFKILLSHLKTNYMFRLLSDLYSEKC